MSRRSVPEAPDPDCTVISPPLVLLGAPTLGSEPGALPVGPDRPADSELDGGSVPGMVVRAASIRGDDHRFYGDVRQDAFALTPVPGSTPALIVSVADGVGSEPLSHLGAASAGRYLHDELRACLPQLLDPVAEHELDGHVHAAYAAVARRMRVDADDRGVDPRRFATTLVGAVFGPRRAVLFRVGDSLAYTLRGGRFRPVFGANDASVVDTSTSALPTAYETVEIRIAELAAGDVVLLCTDGMGGPLSSAVVARQIADWWQPGPPDLAEFYWQLSFRAQTYGDDRTAACVWIN